MLLHGLKPRVDEQLPFLPLAVSPEVKSFRAGLTFLPLGASSNLEGESPPADLDIQGLVRLAAGSKGQ